MVQLRQLPFLGRKNFRLILFINQILWIKYCEANIISYSGKNGKAIREADYNELCKCWDRLK